MFKATNALVAENGIVYMKMIDGSFLPYVPYEELVRALDAIGIGRASISDLVTEGYEELIKYNKGENNG